MGMNVIQVNTGNVSDLQTAVTSTATGASKVKPATKCTFQAYGTTTAGAGAATILIQVSNVDSDTDFITAGTISLTLGVTNTTDGFTLDAPWKYVRSKVSAISGTGASVTATMGW